MARFDELGFYKDPYNLPDPALIETRYIEWNRSDLPDQHTSVEAFVQDAARGYKTSLLVFGPIGSGKTWLSRVVEKEYSALQPDGIVLKTRVVRFQADLAAVYETFVDSFLEDGQALSKIARKISNHAEWTALFPNNRDLGMALYHIATQSPSADVARNWLRGGAVPAGELKQASISVRIGSALQRYGIVRSLIEKCVEFSPSVVLIVDELENADPKFAREFGDMLRELLDSFVDKFGLCCLFTGESLEDFFDHGYVETLVSRIRHKVTLSSIEPDAAAGWLRKHQGIYRKGSYGGNQLDPFSEPGLRQMLGLMKPGKMYPRAILSNCGHMAREYEVGGKAIDASFIEKHKLRLENLD